MNYKSILQSLPVLALLALAPAALAQSGGSFNLSWNTLDSAGGACAGGAFALNGTIGQPDATPPSVGGGYTLTGGFWTGIAEVGPSLKIVGSGNGVFVSWPASAAGFRLQHCDSLGRTPRETRWLDNVSPAFVFGEDKVVFEPANGIRFYRLIKP